VETGAKLAETQGSDQKDDIDQKIDQKITELEGKVATKDYVNEKDDFRKQYVDDQLAKAKEESLDGEKNLKEEISKCLSQDEVNNLINDKDKELREYIDSKAGG